MIIKLLICGYCVGKQGWDVSAPDPQPYHTRAPLATKEFHRMMTAADAASPRVTMMMTAADAAGRLKFLPFREIL